MESTEKRKFDEGNGDTQSNAPKRRVIGPSLPPASASAQVAHETSSGSESDESDDDFGPSLPPPDGVSVPVEQSVDRSTSPVHGKKESQRDQWMLAPPDGSDWATKLDPTQLRNRKFQTGRSAGSGGSKQVDSSWVETPEERMRRLGDAVMGVGSPSSDTKPKASNTARAKSMEERIKKYNDQSGKNSRLESAEARKEEDDDPGARAFDREKDMAISSKISNAKRREMVNKASDYTSRFSRGEFL